MCPEEVNFKMARTGGHAIEPSGRGFEGVAVDECGTRRVRSVGLSKTAVMQVEAFERKRLSLWPADWPSSGHKADGLVCRPVPLRWRRADYVSGQHPQPRTIHRPRASAFRGGGLLWVLDAAFCATRQRMCCRLQPCGCGEIDAEAIAAALIVAGHFGTGVTEVFLDIAFVDVGIGGKACAQGMA